MRPAPSLKRTYRQVIGNRVYPPPEGLQVSAVPHQDGELFLVDIPAQPEALKPFLVHGAILDGKTEDAFISIVRRHGDVSIPVSPAAIHGALAAGRALLHQTPSRSLGTESRDPEDTPRRPGR